MDKCLRTIVAVTVLSQLTEAGSYPGVRLDKHSQFHHSFEHHDPGEWTDGAHSWEPSDHYSNEPDQYPSKRSKEYWRLHHNDGYEPHFHGEPHRPREWHHHEPDSWPGPHHHHPGSWSNNGWPHKGRPSWDHGRPNSWEDQGRPSDWYDQSGNNEWYNQQRPDPVPDSRKPVTWGPVTPPTTASPITNDRSPLAIATCIRSCPVTSEYNPVCGTNNVTYGNPGRLDCAKFCGVDVTLARNSPCPPAGATSDTTPQRNVTKPTQPAFPSEPNTDRPEPTRFTTVDVPVTNMPNKEPDPATIPADILNSIFTSTTTEETEYAFDIRTRSQFMPQYVYPIETK